MPSTTDKARKVAEEALARLSTELEAGKSETLKAYLTAMGRFRQYSWNNVMLISSQRPSATRVAGIHAWNDLGRTVKKGEKGIMIFAPMIVKRSEPPTPQEKEAVPKAPPRLSGFRAAYVFDVSQTEGKPMPEFAKTTGDPKDLADKLKTMAAGRAITVEYDSSLGNALGVSSGGRIRLKPDLSKSEEFSVLVHELAHEMLHQGKKESFPPVVRETQAEAVAFVVCRGVGLETITAAADYIKLYNGDKKTLTESLSVVQETSAQILDELLPEERLTPSRHEFQATSNTAPEPLGQSQSIPMDR